MKSYSEKLKDPRWQRKRLEVMQRDDFTCRLCGNAEKTLNVHHCNYGKGKEPWDYPDSNLVTLCEDCHTGVEDVQKWTRQVISTDKLAKSAIHFLTIFFSGNVPLLDMGHSILFQTKFGTLTINVSRHCGKDPEYTGLEA
jgi:hypothetical protein